MPEPIYGHGLCECGCGEKTNLASETSERKGWVKGEPLRWVYNHHTRLSPFEFLEEDRGHDTPCWIWQRGCDPMGYGRKGSGLAHRAYYEDAKGAIPLRLDLDHLCRVPACVNPDHLEAVPRAINIRRGLCAKLTQEDVDAIRSSGATHADLARVYEVHPTTILRIRRLEKWKPVASY